MSDYYESKYSGEEIDALLDGRAMPVRGSYPTYSDIVSAFPSGNDGIYQAQDTGIMYAWNETEQEWQPLGQITGPQGERGEQGEQGVSVQTAVVDTSGRLIVTLSDGQKIDAGYVLGPAGPTGQPGPAGSSIDRIERTSGNGAPGTTDTYTVYLTDGSTSTFQVYNGKDGYGSGDMTKSVYDPTGRAEDIFSVRKISDGGTGETTVDGVVEAFGIFLAISAAAAYDPEGSYAVGDYCTHGGKLHKCGTAIPDGEEWNAEHWTATTVAADLAEVHDLLAPLGGATTPQEALANLGAGVRPNELDNPGLCANQRGQDSYTGNGGEPVTFDRWQAGLHTTIAKNSGNIVVSASGGAGYILQRLENPILGKPIVFSVLTTSGLYECKGVVNSGGSITQATPFGAISVTHGARMYALIQLNDGQSITLPVQDGDVAKLEIGDTQTLAYQDEDGAWQLLPQPESDYATQLAKCQRYLAAMENKTIVRSAYVSTDFVDFLVPIPVSFRVLPIIQGAEKLVLITQPDGEKVSGATWSIATKSSASVRLRASKPNIWSEGTDFSVYTDQGATFFSAEL